MHNAAFRFVERVLADRLGVFTDVVEIGSRNINGSVRQLFSTSDRYLATDITGGNGVDRIVDASDASALPAESCDTVVCCEVLEHTPVAPIIKSAATWLRPGGFLIATMAGEGRAPHSAVDGGKLRANEHYQNVTAEEMITSLDAAGLLPIIVETNAAACDLYVLAWKPVTTVSGV